MYSIKDTPLVEPLKQRERESSIFVWLDILGFSTIVEDETKYEELSNLLKKFQDLFNECDLYNSTIISDGIILQINAYNITRLKQAFEDIGKKQLQFINKNRHFIRGGIAVGSKLEDSSDKNHSFISNGLARAVYIESNKIDWAVIGTTKDHIEKIRQIFNIYDEKEFFDLKCTYNNKGEEIYFIDFIEENERYYHLVDNQRKEHNDKPNIKNKYIWLLRYYHHKYHNDDMDESLLGVIL